MHQHEIRERIAHLAAQTTIIGEELQALIADIDGGDAIQVPRQGRWTRSMLAQTWERVNHLPGMRALFEATADHPNEAVNYETVRERSGLSSKQQGNEHARLSRVTAELFGAKTWPIENWQAANGEMFYRMGGTVADWFRDLNR